VAVALLLSLLAVGWDVPLWHTEASGAVGPRLLAACAMLLLGVGVVGGGALDRALRDVPRRRVPWTLVALGGLVLGIGKALGYAAVAGQLGAFPAWVEDGPTVLAGVLLGTGAVMAAWPPGMSRREAVYVVVDTVVAALALLVIWQLYVLPLERNDDGQSVLSDVLVHVDGWWQWGALVVVVLIAATSRRSGSLSFTQLLLMQAAFGLFVLSDLAGDVLPAADAASSVTPSILGYALAGAIFVTGITGRGVSPTRRTRRCCERWAIALPGAVLVVGLVTMLVYRLMNGTLPWPTVVDHRAVRPHHGGGRDLAAAGGAGVPRLGGLRASLPLEQAVRGLADRSGGGRAGRRLPRRRRRPHPLRDPVRAVGARPRRRPPDRDPAR
jgi:hypothetical protein